MNGLHIPGTPIVVDYWRLKEVPPRALFFLTHMHADHTSGLRSSWPYPIHCTPTTAKLLIKKFNIDPNQVVTLEVGDSHILHVNCPGDSVMINVTVLDANHCPGSAMFFFEGYFGSILYTGDFRFSQEMQVHPLLNGNRTVDVLYLDNTYCHPSCQFPTREEAIETVISLAEDNPELTMFIGLHTLGKENLLVELARRLETWVGVTTGRYETLKLLEMPDVFRTEIHSCRIQVYPFYMIAKTMLEELRNQDPTVMAILPSCLFVGEGAPKPPSNPYIKVVPYSDHCSYHELRQFVSSVRPRCVRPVVRKFSGDKGISTSRANMSVFDGLLDRSPPHEYEIPASIQHLIAMKSPETMGRSLSHPPPFKRRSSLGSSGGKQSKNKPKGVHYISPVKFSIETCDENQVPDTTTTVRAELCGSSKLLTTRKAELCESSELTATKKAELCESSELTATKKAELCESSELTATKKAELCEISELTATKKAEMCEGSELTATKKAELCESSELTATKKAELCEGSKPTGTMKAELCESFELTATRKRKAELCELTATKKAESSKAEAQREDASLELMDAQLHSSGYGQVQSRTECSQQVCSSESDMENMDSSKENMNVTDKHHPGVIHTYTPLLRPLQPASPTSINLLYGTNNRHTKKRTTRKLPPTILLSSSEAQPLTLRHGLNLVPGQTSIDRFISGGCPVSNQSDLLNEIQKLDMTSPLVRQVLSSVLQQALRLQPTGGAGLNGEVQAGGAGLNGEVQAEGAGLNGEVHAASIVMSECEEEVPFPKQPKLQQLEDISEESTGHEEVISGHEELHSERREEEHAPPRNRDADFSFDFLGPQETSMSAEEVETWLADFVLKSGH